LLLSQHNSNELRVKLVLCLRLIRNAHNKDSLSYAQILERDAPSRTKLDNRILVRAHAPGAPSARVAELDHIALDLVNRSKGAARRRKLDRRIPPSRGKISESRQKHTALSHRRAERKCARQHHAKGENHHRLRH
jgi:hypothetical protein